MATFAIGTDTGGSIRIPASCCGIVGFKPSFNLLSREGTFPLGYSLDHLGPLTTSVTDAAYIMDVLLERPGQHSKRLEASLSGVRLGVPTDYFTVAQADVATTYDRVLEAAEAAAIHYRTLVDAGERLGSDVRVRLTAALFIPAFARIRAQQIRRLLFDDLAAAFANVDALITPTLPITPPRPGTATVQVGHTTMPTSAAFLRNTCPFNLTGVPAISIPAPTTADGAPVGIQIAGPYGADLRVLQIARGLEREVTGHFTTRAKH